MLHEDPVQLITRDMRRTTEILEIAAGDLSDEFLQYLYGMAILHLRDRDGLKMNQNGAPVRSGSDAFIKNLAEQVIASSRR